jgi:hypothetical protein
MVFDIFAGFVLVHVAVLSPGGLQPVTGALVIAKRALQLEKCDEILVHFPVNVFDLTNTIFVKRLYVILKFVLDQDFGECPFGHLF